MSNSNWWLGDLNNTSGNGVPFVNARSKKLGPVGTASTAPLDYGEWSTPLLLAAPNLTIAVFDLAEAAA